MVKMPGHGQHQAWHRVVKKRKLAQDFGSCSKLAAFLPRAHNKANFFQS
jgi:hypothetical protein